MSTNEPEAFILMEPGQILHAIPFQVIDADFQQRVYDTNVAKGFHADPATQHPAIKVALIHSELSELLEVLRNGRPWPEVMSAKCPEITAVAEELADTVIRCLDMAGALGIDLVAAVHAKQAYNETRPHKHGKAF